MPITAAVTCREPDRPLGRVTRRTNICRCVHCTALERMCQMQGSASLTERVRDGGAIAPQAGKDLTCHAKLDENARSIPFIRFAVYASVFLHLYVLAQRMVGARMMRRWRWPRNSAPTQRPFGGGRAGEQRQRNSARRISSADWVVLCRSVVRPGDSFGRQHFTGIMSAHGEQPCPFCIWELKGATL